jgi:hypothetical protein
MQVGGCKVKNTRISHDRTGMGGEGGGKEAQSQSALHPGSLLALRLFISIHDVANIVPGWRGKRPFG